MPFDKDEGILQKAGVKAFLKAIFCPYIKPLMMVGISVTKPRVIQVQYLTVHYVQCIYLIYYCGA